MYVVFLAYLFMRGQGIKIFSVLSRECMENDYLIPLPPRKGVDEKGNNILDDEGYEGAAVLPPDIGLYLEDPIAVMDFSSLYPSCMISENLSHETYCSCLCQKECNGKICNYTEYNNLEGYEYRDVKFDLFDSDKNIIGEKTCRFVQYPDGKYGIVPNTLRKLLKARKDTRKKR